MGYSEDVPLTVLYILFSSDIIFVEFLDSVQTRSSSATIMLVTYRESVSGPLLRLVLSNIGFVPLQSF